MRVCVCVSNSIKAKSAKSKEKWTMRKTPENQCSTYDLPCISIFDRYAHCGSRVSPKTALNIFVREKAHIPQKQQPET